MQVSLEALHSQAVYPEKKKQLLSSVGNWIILYLYQKPLFFLRYYTNLDCPILNCKHIFRIGTLHDQDQSTILRCIGHKKSCHIRNNPQTQPENIEKY